MPKSNMFQKILAQIRRVPLGKVATYGDVAYAAGFPGAARQAAWALHGSGASGVQFIGLRVDMKNHHHSFFRTKPTKKRAPSIKKKRASKTRQKLSKSRKLW